MRLASLSPNLAQSFRNADDKRRRQAVFAACSVAVLSAGLRDDETSSALEILRTGTGNFDAARESLEASSAQYDEKYFELSDDTNEVGPEAMLFFRKARAASALAFALASDHEQLHESLYEAISASDDQKQVTRVVEDALAAG